MQRSFGGPEQVFIHWMSIDFIVSAHCFEKNGFLAIMLPKAKDYSEVIACAACPGSLEFSLEFVCPQTWMKSIVFKQA